MRITCMICSSKNNFVNENKIMEKDDTIACYNCNTLYSLDIATKKYTIVTWICDHCGIESVDEKAINKHEEKCLLVKNEISELKKFLIKEKNLIKDLNLKNLYTEETKIKISHAASVVEQKLEKLNQFYIEYQKSFPRFSSAVSLYSNRQFTELMEEIEDKKKLQFKNLKSDMDNVEKSLEQLYNYSNLIDKISEIKRREKALDYDSAIKMWEELEYIDEAARVRRLQAEMGAVNIAQKVVQGDEITEIKDSVVSKSNIGSGGDDKFAKLERLAEMKKEGLIDDEEFKQMKKEILGK